MNSPQPTPPTPSLAAKLLDLAPIDPGDVLLIHGPAKTGKTALAWAISCEYMFSAKAGLLELRQHPRCVCWLDGDIPAFALRGRFTADAATRHGLTVTGEDYQAAAAVVDSAPLGLFAPGEHGLDRGDLPAALAAAASWLDGQHGQGGGVLVVDALDTFAPGEMGDAVIEVKNAARDLGLAAVIVTGSDHSRWASRSHVDAVINLRPGEPVELAHNRLGGLATIPARFARDLQRWTLPAPTPPTCAAPTR